MQQIVNLVCKRGSCIWKWFHSTNARAQNFRRMSMRWLCARLYYTKLQTGLTSCKAMIISWAVVRFFNIKLNTGRHNTNQQLAACSAVQLNKSVYWHHHCVINVTRVTRHLLNFCLLHRAVDVLNSKPWLLQRMKRLGRKQVFWHRFVALTLATELCKL